MVIQYILLYEVIDLNKDIQYEDFFPERLAKLRNAKNISARDMSLSIGQNENYINQIENKKTLPSMQGFFYICEFLDVSPKEFFDEENIYPESLNNLIKNAKNLNKKCLIHLIGLTEELAQRK